MKPRNRGLILLLLAAACESSIVDSGTAHLSLQIIAGDDVVLSSVESVRVHVEGPTSRTVDVLTGNTATIGNLPPGSYTVAVEGFTSSEVETYGETTGVVVNAGGDTPVNVVLANFVPALQTLPASIMVGETLNVHFNGVGHAVGYTVELADNPSFSNVTPWDATGTSIGVQMTATGVHYLRVRARDRYHPSSIGRASSAQAVNVTGSVAIASQLAVVTQPGGAVSGVAFAAQPVIELRDAQNQPVTQAGVAVTATVATGSGQLGGTFSATTNAQGRATFTNLMITGTGTHSLRFTSQGLTPATSQTFTVTLAPATQLAVVTQPDGAVSGQAFATQPVIELRDSQNQPVSQAGVSVTAAVASGSGTLGGTLSATTNAQGRATFSNLQITGTGVHSLRFASTGLTPAVSQSFTVASVPPTPTQLAVVTQPGGAVSGVAFTAQPVIELRDAQNQPVQQSGVVVTVAKALGSGTLSGTLTATTNAQGRATFTNLTITGTGPHTLSFAATGLSGTTSQSFTVASVPPTPTQLAVVTQPGGAVSGVAFTTQPVIELRDAQNQPVQQSGVVVTAAKALGSGTLSGTLTATTNAQGRATFTNLTITGTGPHTLSFAATGLSGTTSQSFTVASVPPTPTQLAVVTQPGGAVSGVAFTTQPVIELRDAQNQPVQQSGVVVTVAKASGSGTLSGTLTATTNAQGRATFTNLTIAGTGAHTLGFSATGLTGTTSQSFTVTSGTPVAGGLSIQLSQSTIMLGQTVDVTVSGSNIGNAASTWGALSVSFPDLQSPTNANQVQVLVGTSSDLSVGMYPTETTINDTTNTPMTAQYLLVEGADNNWTVGETNQIVLHVQPTSVGNGTFTIYARESLFVSGQTYSRDPSSGTTTDQQGGYVELATVTVTPAPSTPVAGLLSVSVSQSTITLGQTVDVTVSGSNVGNAASTYGALSVSFPGLTSSNDANQVQVLGGTSSGIAVGMYPAGSTIYDVTNVAIPAQYLLVEGADQIWSAGETNQMVLRVKPKATGTFEIYAREYLLVSGQTYSRDPSSGTETDQQGGYVLVETVTVTAPEPQVGARPTALSVNGWVRGGRAPAPPGGAERASYLDRRWRWSPTVHLPAAPAGVKEFIEQSPE